MKHLLFIFIFALSLNASAYELFYRMSNNGIAMLKTHEGCVLTPYLDGGTYAIGYGHHKNVNKWTKKITLQQAEKLLQEDVLWINKELSLHIIPEVFGNRKVLIPQVLLDAIGDMIFRKGATTFKQSEVYATLKKCRTDAYNYILDSDLRFLCSKIRNYQVTSEAIRVRNEHLCTLVLEQEYFIRKVNIGKVYVN